MKDWIVEVREEYRTTYRVKAATEEEAQELAIEMNIEGAPEQNCICEERTTEARLADSEGDSL